MVNICESRVGEMPKFCFKVMDPDPFSDKKILYGTGSIWRGGVKKPLDPDPVSWGKKKPWICSKAIKAIMK